MKSDSNSSDFASLVLNKAKNDARSDSGKTGEEAAGKMEEVLSLSEKQRELVRNLVKKTETLHSLLSTGGPYYHLSPFG